MTDFNPDFGQVIKTLRTKSAVNPALIFAAICMAGGLAGAILAPEPLNYVFLGVVLVGVVIPALQIAIFTAVDRDRLQDEEHIENRMLIQALVPMLGDSNNLIELEASPILSSNPELPGGE
jgi:hypothetical protein